MKELLPILITLATSGLVPTASAGLIVNGSFESPVLLGTSRIVPDGWTQVLPGPSHAPYFFKNSLAMTAPDGTQYLDIGNGQGSGVYADANNLGISQSFTVSTTGDYLLTWSDNAFVGFSNVGYKVEVLDSSSAVVASGTFSVLVGATSWNSRSLAMTLNAGSYTLRFQPTAGTFNDTLLDNVSLDAVLAATAPGPVTVQCGDPLPSVAADLASFTAQGGSARGECGTLTVAHVGDVPTGTCPMSIARTYRVADACGHHVDCTQTITVQDTTVPVATTPAGSLDRTVESGDDVGWLAAIALAPTFSDACAGEVIPLPPETRLVPDSGCANAFATERRWHAVDPCGNTSLEFIQRITSVDTTPPVIGAPGANVTIECPNTPVFTPPTVTDGGDPNPTLVSVLEDPVAAPCPAIYAQTKRWHAVDACGNLSATVSQTITVRDTTPPVLSAAGANEVIECPATPSFTPPTATDNCDSAPTIEIVSETTTPPGSCLASYSRTRTWRAVDACGNVSETRSQTITVQDTTPPMIATEIVSAADLFPPVGITFDSGLVGQITFYSSTKRIRRLHLRNFLDHFPPPALGAEETFTPLATAAFEFSEDGGTTWSHLEAGCGLSLKLAHTSDTGDASSFDIEIIQLNIAGGSLPTGIRLRESPSKISSGKITIRSAPAGFTFTGFVDVNIEMSLDDGVAFLGSPDSVRINALSGSLDRTLERGDAAGLAAALALAPTFSDACSGTAPATTLETINLPDPTCIDAETMVRRWTAADACGNTSLEFVQTIQIKDTTLPSIICPENKLIVTGPGPVTYSAMAADNADPAPTITFDPPSGSTFPMGRTVVMCRAADRCGNINTCAFTVTVTAFGCTAGSQQAYVKASNPAILENFGTSVAISGDTMVVGAYNEASSGVGVNGIQSDKSAFGSGAAYIFVRSGATWTQQAYLKASNPDVLDHFGCAVAISGDTVVVGALGESSGATGVIAGSPTAVDNSATESGAAYIFVRSSSTWRQQAYLKASNTHAGDHFGSSVAISGDTVVVGAPEADSSADGSGLVCVFARSGSIWNYQTSIRGRTIGFPHVFGYSVAIDGDTMVVGAPYTYVGGSSSAWVFVGSGPSWTEQGYLQAPLGGPGGRFGRSVAVSASGNTLAVGAPEDDSSSSADPSDHSAPGSGAVSVFVRSGSTWSRQSYVKASNIGADDRFGWSVAVSASGETLVVGAPGESSGNASDPSDNSAPGSGAAYAFVRSGSVWNQQAYLKASNIGGGDYYGTSAAISGETVVVGAIGENSSASGVNGNQLDDSLQDPGAAYVFTLANEPCALDDTFRIPAGAPLIIPIGVLLGNDAHSRGLPIFFTGCDSATALGAAITSVGSPATALEIPTEPNFPPGVTEDTFTYRISDGTHKASATVHLIPVAIPTAPAPNKLAFLPTPPSVRGLTILFNAPAVGTYVLQRKTLAIPGTNSLGGVWTDVATLMPSGPGVAGFFDVFMSTGAMYRVQSVP